MATDIQKRRLPVWRIFKASYLALFRNLGLAFRLAIVPYILGFLPIVVLAIFTGGMMLDDPAILDSAGVGGIALFYAATLVSSVAIIPMITAWHRLVILGHDHSNARLRYSIARSEWRYLLKLVMYFTIVLLLSIALIFGVFAAGAALSVLLATNSFGSTIASTGLIVGSVLLYGYYIGLILRLCMVFPAAAVGTKLSFRDSWRLSKGNTWRLFFTFMIVLLPTAVISILISLVVLGVVYFDPMASVMPGVGTQLVHLVVNMPIWITTLCTSTSLWSWSYRYLVEGEEITLPGERST